MRCPKCGYISFDTFGTCKKCNREIGELLEELEGTVFEAAAPSFLHIRSTGTLADTPEPEAEDAVDFLEEEQQDEGLSLADSFADEDVLTEDMDLNGEEVGIEFEEMEEVEVSSEIVLEESVLEDADSGSSGIEKETDLELDFGDIDISDLAPPETEEEASMDAKEREEEAAAKTLPEPKPAAAAISSTSGLEDLQVEDLDLDAPAPLVSGSKVGDKLMPSVKTGTALDDFDIDLGELISKEK